MQLHVNTTNDNTKQTHLNSTSSSGWQSRDQYDVTVSPKLLADPEAQFLKKKDTSVAMHSKPVPKSEDHPCFGGNKIQTTLKNLAI